MNVYDNANDLAKAMRESHEYKKLKEAAAVSYTHLRAHET